MGETIHQFKPIGNFTNQLEVGLEEFESNERRLDTVDENRHAVNSLNEQIGELNSDGPSTWSKWRKNAMDLIASAKFWLIATPVIVLIVILLVVYILKKKSKNISPV